MTIPVHSSHVLSPEAEADFRRRLRGEIRTDEVTRGAYATDASMYQIMPLAVIEPLDRDDAVEAVRICATHHLSLLPRGGGTSLVGQAVGQGVVIDMSRHCHRLVDFNATERWVRVEPGMVRDELNRNLSAHALHFAPDPATTSRANIGGMIANNAAGMRSIRYGMTIDHVLEITLVLADGEVITLGLVSEQDLIAPPRDRAEDMSHQVLRIVQREKEDILARFPKVGRRSGGYPLDAFTGPGPWNLAKLVAGSEGTLGLILDAKLNLEPIPAWSGLCLAHFATLGDALRAVQPIMAHQPTAIEFLDGIILDQARDPSLTREISSMIEGQPEGLLIIESRSDQADDVKTTLKRIRTELLSRESCYAAPVITEPDQIKQAWSLREDALGLITTIPGDRKPTPYIEDAAVPLDVLPDYVEQVLAVCANHGQPVSLFGHAGAGLLHIRPLHDLHRREDIAEMLSIQDEVFDLVKAHRGSWSGEHGDGIIRGGFNRAFFGERIFQAFRDIKNLFDPEGRMNPGKLLDPPPRDQQLRFGTTLPDTPPLTAFRWQEEGGLPRATEQCTGIGVCRRIKSGVMCPSYMATRDELHSTRGRANVLRLALAGHLGPDALSRDDVLAVFDLCISCKGCRSECPNRVDVGKMKAELLHQHFKTHRRPLRSHLFARVDTLGRLQSGHLAPIAKALLTSPGLRWLLDRLLGIDAQRPLPGYARQRLSAWFRARSSASDPTAPRVVLFNDVYSEYHEPEIGQAAIRVLEAYGFRVDLLEVMDSQRAALSQGMLDRARVRGSRLIEKLHAVTKQGCPILVIEPSCATAIIQDLPDLVDNPDFAAEVAANVHLVDTFLAESLRQGRARLPAFSPRESTVFFHPHCHQRALDQGRGTTSLLSAIPGTSVLASPAGCCGMAGSFGYEKEHAGHSRTMAEDRLLPALRTLDPQTAVLATGFSCRHQIAELSEYQPIHPLQWIDQGITTPSGHSEDLYQHGAD